MAPQVGLEPTTLRLTAGCSAIELLRSDLGRWCVLYAAFYTSIWTELLKTSWFGF